MTLANFSLWTLVKEIKQGVHVGLRLLIPHGWPRIPGRRSAGGGIFGGKDDRYEISGFL